MQRWWNDLGVGRGHVSEIMFLVVMVLVVVVMVVMVFDVAVVEEWLGGGYFVVLRVTSWC